MFRSQKKKSLKLNISEEDSFEKKQLENNLDDTEKFISGSQNLIKTSKVIVVDKSDQFRKVFKHYNYSTRFRQSGARLNQELDKIIKRPQMKFDEILKKTPKTPFVNLKQSEIELKSCIKSNQFKESKKGVVLCLGKNTSPFDINVNKINVKRKYQIDNNIVQNEEPKNFTPLPLPGSITNNLLKMIKNNTKSPLFQRSLTKDSIFNISNNSRPSTSFIAKPRAKIKINKYSCILVTSQVDKLKKSFLPERVKSAAEAKNEFVNIEKLKDKRREYMENFKIKPHIDLIVAGDAYKRRVMSLVQGGTPINMIDEFFKNDDNSFLIESKSGKKTIEERKSKIVIYKNILGSPKLKKHYDDDVQNNNLNIQSIQSIQSNKVNEISFKTPNNHIKPRYFSNF